MSDPRPAPAVYVVDDSEDMRKSLEELLGLAGYEVLCFGHGPDFVSRASELDMGVVLLDLRMPGMGGLEVLELLGEQVNRLAIIVITAHGEIEMAVRAMKAGARNFMQKPFDDNLLIDTIEREFGALLESARIRANVSDPLAALTARERQVAISLGRGLSNKQVAQDLGISVRTVEMHRARAMQRLGCRSFADFLRVVLQAH